MDSDFIQIPAELWRHRLFIDSARYTTPVTSVSAGVMDVRLRQIRNMPSTGDSGAVNSLTGFERVLVMGRCWLKSSVDPVSLEAQAILARLGRVIQHATTDTSDVALLRMVRSVALSLPPGIAAYLPAVSCTRTTLVEALQAAEDLTLDHYLRRSPAAHRYLGRVYKALDSSFDFNTTTDTVRLEPVYRLIHRMAAKEGWRDASFVDVGCAAVAGAPGPALAGRILREGRTFQAVHGVDVRMPPRERIVQLLRAARVLLYESDAVRRTLPRRYDVILLANVHRHLTTDLQVRMLGNLLASLREGGLLFVNWNFGADGSPCVCLRRTGASTRIILDIDLAPRPVSAVLA